MYHSRKLTADLANLGVVPGDTLLVHASIKSVGEVENRGNGILDALLAAVGKSGLLVLPTLTYDLPENALFDPQRTQPVVGTLPILFLKYPGVKRSLHPTHSVAAYGPDAADFIAGHENCTSPGPRTSPWGKLVDRQAKILFLGTGIGCNTFLHCVEEWNGGIGLAETPKTFRILCPDGSEKTVQSRPHSGHHNHFYAKLETCFVQHGLMRRGKVGDADCALLDAAGIAKLVSGFLNRDPDFFTDNRAPQETK